jgi:PAS domain S-box-containing protein
MRTIDIQLEHLMGLEGSIMYRDEVLTMSAKMAAATGDLQWVSRYEEFGPRVKPAVQESWSISKDDAATTQGILSGFADDKLVKIEKDALELVRQGKCDRAAALLQSPEYQEQKHLYGSGMKAFATNMRSALEERRESHFKNVQKALAAIGIFLLVIVVVAMIGRKVGKRLHRRPAKKQKNAFARQWQETFDAITDGVCIIDKDAGKILECNRAMTRFVETPYSEVIGRSCCELLHDSSEPVKRCPLVRMYKTRRSQAADFQVGERWLHIKVDPLIDNEGRLVGAVHIMSDITEHRKANRALRESENKFRLAFANAQDAMVWIERETGVITNCNKAAEGLFAKGKNQIIGQHHTTLYPQHKAQRYHNLFTRPSKELDGNIEAQIVTARGQIRTVTIALSTMLVEGKEIAQGIIRDITESRRAIDEIKNLAKFPSEDPNPVLRISSDCMILYANDAGSPVLKTWRAQRGERLPEPWRKRIADVYQSGDRTTFELDCDDGHTFVITLQPIAGSGYVNAYGLDITQRKKAEQQKIELELQLSQKQKMEAIGTLAGGIAHDFNNILAAMQGYAELSLDDLAEDSPVRNNLEQIMACSSRATKLVKQILTFSPEGEQKKEPVQISAMVKEVLGMLRSSLPATIKICRRIHAASSVIMADPTQIHQILVNLCTNASHAMRQTGGQLDVSLADVHLDSETRIGNEYLRPGPYVQISVSDSGCGMDKEVLDRIFEPFFTTKKESGGTGLGLSVVHGIVKSHDGAITVRSTPGQGTTFDIFFPRMEDAEVQQPQSPQLPGRERQVILLVDDEQMMVDVTGQILERLGFAVVAKTNSIDALQAFQEAPDEFDLVITDQVMPNMTGTELAKNLISVRPDIPVILCSGFPENVCLEELKTIGVREFVMKPIGRQEIEAVIHTVLGEASVKV